MGVAAVGEWAVCFALLIVTLSVRFAFALPAVALLVGCGAKLAPKQARFELGPCEPSFAIDVETAGWGARPEPVIERGPAGSWDSTDALNPTVVRRGGVYYNLYSGYDGAVWRTGLAISNDGVVWEKDAASPVIEPDGEGWEGSYIAANGSLLETGGDLAYWYQAGPRGATRIGLARSTDGRSWSKHPEPVLEPGPLGGWDDTAVGDPYVVRCRDFVAMFYLGQNRFSVQRLGVAISTDGVHWRKSHRNPLLEPGGEGSFDQRGLGEPAVFSSGGKLWMLYVGRDAAERRRIGWASSSTGVDWEKAPERGFLDGPAGWAEAVMCDPSVGVIEGRPAIWFGGGSQPSPDENLDGAVGVGTLEASGNE